MAELSVWEQIKMNDLDLRQLLMQSMFDTNSSVLNLQKAAGNKNNTAYAVKGDNKYDKEMDSDSDGTITYNEYVRYISQQNLKKYNIPSNSTALKNIFDSESGTNRSKILNYGKAISSYITNSALLPQGIISRKA